MLDWYKSYFRYEPETGKIFWLKKPAKNILIGTEAGTKRADGYIGIMLKGERILAHRLIWLLHTGQWPKEYIDHADGNPSNNRIENLRECSQSQNIANSKQKTKSFSGIKGVYFECKTGKYMARVMHYGKTYHVGMFRTKEEAKEAYFKKAQELFGCFARSA
jgi:hypothetical protein